MKTLLIFCLILFTLGACKTKSSEKIIISGTIYNKAIKKVYFTDAYDWEVLLDSAEIKNSNFKFSISKDKLKGLVCSIGYKDSTGRRRNFFFKNHILTIDSPKYFISAFLLDSPIIKIDPDTIDREYGYYNIKAGKENDAYYSTQMIEFGYLDKDAVKRTSQLDSYISLIKTYPASQYLLSKIFENKTVINKSELELMLQNFNPEALTKGYGKQLQDYFLSKNDHPVFENMILEDDRSLQATILDPAAKLNMLVVWASWCGPCRKEIPDIKKLNDLYGKKGLSVTNISIDEKREAWQNALQAEQMNWRQLLVSKEKLADFNIKLEVGSIPYVLFVDSNGKLITRFIGYETNRIEEYKKVIEKQLQEKE